MNKLILMVCLVFGAFTMNAQTASTEKTMAKEAVEISDAAMAAMKMDKRIFLATNEKTGAKTFRQKYICPQSGKIVSKEVEYDAATDAFMDVEKSCSAKGPSCSTSAKKEKSCSKDEAKAGKACCKKDQAKAAGKACCKKDKDAKGK